MSLRVALPRPARSNLTIRMPPPGPVEGEVTHVRRLTGIWRWLLVIMTAATIALCINQQFNLRFFVGYTQLNTEYYYLLIFCMLPFTFLIFPGSRRRTADRIPWYDAAAVRRDGRLRALPDVQRAQVGAARLGVHRSADARRRGRLRHVGHADGGAAPDGRLEPAAQRVPLHRLSAVCRAILARPPARPAIDARSGGCLSHAVGGEPARHSDPGVCRYRHRLPGVRHGADDDGCRQVLHQSGVSRSAARSAAARPRSASSRAACSA